MVYFVYIIKSTLKNWHYIGFTTNIESRLQQHNNKLVRSTKFYAPYYLVFVQFVNSAVEARKLEKFLKVRFNKEALLDII